MLQQEQVEAINPNRWIYAKWYKGEEVSLAQYNKIVNDWTRYQQIAIVAASCKATNSIAVHSALLSRRQRDKYKERRAQIGRKSFYYFSRDEIPLDVFSLIEWGDNRYVYEKTD